jgi:hypothetical protein
VGHVGPFGRAAVRLATAFLPPGPVHARYRAELEAELAELPAWRRTGPALSMVAAGPALHRSLVESGALEFVRSPVWCRLRLHHRFRVVSADDGALFRRCRDCGLDNDGTYNPRMFGGYGIEMHGTHSG